MLLLTVIVCICLIGGNDECDNSQDSLNKKGERIMDIVVASSEVAPQQRSQNERHMNPKERNTLLACPVSKYY